MIESINIITAQGTGSYYLGQAFEKNYVSKIVKTELLITGDPFDHYCGYDKDGNMLFSINCLVPCVVHYMVAKEEKK